jgi:hypothetical protein
VPANHSSRPSFSTLVQFGFTLVLLVCVAVFIARTWHWPLVGDAPLMHYVVFLMDHGKIPYRDIIDINLPGTYLVEGLVMHLFGGSSLPWRLFDLFLSGLCTLAMIAIAWPRDRFAGFFAGALFLLLHGRDGLIELGQRDLVMTALLLLGYVFLFQILRSAQPSPRRLLSMAACGLCFGFAVTIKATPILLGPPLILAAAVELRRRKQPWIPSLLTGCAALLLPAFLMVAFLVHDRALHAFLAIVFRLVPAHEALRHRPLGYLLANCIASPLIPLVLLWIPVALSLRFWRTWEGAALWAGVLFGIASFCVQGKGYPYHRYPCEAFLLLVIAIDLCVALGVPAPGTFLRSWRRSLALAGLAFAAFVVGAGSTRKAIHYDWRNQEFDTLLEADLTRLGGPHLNERVQCLDVAAGCLNALYRMRLVQSTGFLYDCYLLEPVSGDDPWRSAFWNDIVARPPAVFVVTSHQCGLAPMNYSYSQLRQWPQFDVWLTAHYTLYADRIPPHPLNWIGEPVRPFGYRILVRNDFHPPGFTEGGSR